MTTTRPTHPPASPAPTTPFFRLPDIPEKHPDDVTSVQHLHEPGHTHLLSQYLGNPDTTLVTGERYVILGPDFDASDCRCPDLLVAIGVDPAVYLARNGYVATEQGKPPDFVMEVASRHSATEDRGVKKDYYERLGVGEYWLFDSEGAFYGFVLKGYRLVEGRYEEIEAREVRPGVFEGYSAALNLILRVEDGLLGLYDPASGEHIPTFQSERARGNWKPKFAGCARADRQHVTRNPEAPGAGIQPSTKPAYPTTLNYYRPAPCWTYPGRMVIIVGQAAARRHPSCGSFRARTPGQSGGRLWSRSPASPPI